MTTEQTSSSLCVCRPYDLWLNLKGARATGRLPTLFGNCVRAGPQPSAVAHIVNQIWEKGSETVRHLLAQRPKKEEKESFYFFIIITRFFRFIILFGLPV